MKIYLVGGAVRDKLLGIKPKEQDWVVVGATPEQMLQKGFRQVGKDFPVFLHSKTHEEYALARIERKIGKGYTGFAFETSPKVTLEEDLKRRDLTINAIAMDADGSLIDPYNGQKDLKDKLLKHISANFAEDPVRILRVARFAARFNFTVSADTISLMQNMVQNGEINALVPERVTKELENALSEQHPENFFTTLEKCNALEVLFPEIEINSEQLTFLKAATNISNSPAIRFASLFIKTPLEKVKNLCKKYKIPNELKDLAVLISKHSTEYNNFSKLSADKILNFYNEIDAFRREKRFYNFLLVCSAANKKPSIEIKSCYQAAKNINMKDIIKNNEGAEIKIKINSVRKDQILKYLSS